MKTTSSTNPMKRYYWFFGILAIISVLAITTNVVLRRGPVHDAQAADDIRAIQENVDNYYLSHNQLPESIAVLRLTGGVAKRLPQYDYVVTGLLTYQICADFFTNHHSTGRYAVPDSLGGQVADPDEHGKGQQCFSYQVIPVSQQTFPLQR